MFSTVGSILESINKNSYSSISVDDRRESARMVDYLIGLGHTRIAILIAEAEEQSIGKLRLEGYCDSLKAHGIALNPRLVCQTDDGLGHFSMENGYRTTKKLLESKEPFTALYAVADALAIGALRALHEAGMEVPGDVSIAGYDGIDMANYTVPSLTTMHQPVEEMAKATTKLLFNIIAGRAEHQHITYKAELVIKESTDYAARTE